MNERSEPSIKTHYFVGERVYAQDDAGIWQTALVGVVNPMSGNITVVFDSLVQRTILSRDVATAVSRENPEESKVTDATLLHETVYRKCRINTKKYEVQVYAQLKNKAGLTPSHTVVYGTGEKAKHASLDYCVFDRRTRQLTHLVVNPLGSDDLMKVSVEEFIKVNPSLSNQIWALGVQI